MLFHNSIKSFDNQGWQTFSDTFWLQFEVSPKIQTKNYNTKLFYISTIELCCCSGNEVDIKPPLGLFFRRIIEQILNNTNQK